MATSAVVAAVEVGAVGAEKRLEIDGFVNRVELNGAKFWNNGPLIESIDMAIDLSAKNAVTEVYYRGVKVAGFIGGVRVFPKARGRMDFPTPQTAPAPDPPAKPPRPRRTRGISFSSASIERALEETRRPNGRYNIEAAARVVGCTRQTVYNCLGRMKAHPADQPTL